MHLSDDILRTYLDGENTDSPPVKEHLDSCPECRARLAALELRAQRVQTHLAALDPRAWEAPRPLQSAYQRFQQKEKQNMSKRFVWRPVWVAITVVAVLALALSFQPVRALAANFLGLFRVQQVTLLPVDFRSLQGGGSDQTLGSALGQLFSQSADVTRPSKNPDPVADAAEASQKAGFNVRLWSGAPSSPNLMVSYGMAFNFTVKRQQVMDILTQSGVKGPALPASLDGVKLSVDIPAGVHATYGDNCAYKRMPEKNGPASQVPAVASNCITLIEMPSPTAVTTPDVDASQLAAIGLQYLGMDAQSASSYANSVDWATTLVVPVPRGKVDSQDVKVDDVSGKLLHQLDSTSSGSYSLIWVKNGMLYALAGAPDSQTALEIGNNLK